MSWLPDALAQAAARPGFALLAAACLLAGVVRGFSGFGTALVFMPAATTVVPAPVAVAALMIFDAFGSVALLRDGIRRCDRREVAIMTLGVLVGAPAGVWLLATLPAQTLRWIVCLASLAAAGALASGWRARGEGPAWIGAPVGAASGLMGGVAGLSGVPVVLFHLGRARDPVRMRADIVVLFALSSCISAALMAGRGLFGAEPVALGLILGPVFLAGTLAGRLLFPLATPALFRGLAFGLITLSAVGGLPLWD